jgi:hypothetical protein
VVALALLIVTLLLLILLRAFRAAIMIPTLFPIVGIPTETEIVMIEDPRVSLIDFRMTVDRIVVERTDSAMLHAPRRLAVFAEARASIIEAEVVAAGLHRAVVARGEGADRFPAVGVLLGGGVAAVARRFKALHPEAAALCLGVEARINAVPGLYLGAEARRIEVAGRNLLRVARLYGAAPPAAHRAVSRVPASRQRSAAMIVIVAIAV